MAGKDIAAIAFRPEGGEEIGLGAAVVIGAAAAGATRFQQLLCVIDQREIGTAAGGVEADQGFDQIERRIQHPSRETGLPMLVRNSRRVTSFSRKAPSMVDVTMVTPRLWTPRVVMH